MKEGWLITNSFLRTPAFTRLESSLMEAASLEHLRLHLRGNAEFGEISLPEGIEFALFFDKDVRLAFRLEAKGLPVWNSARAIEICDDKTLSQIYFERFGLRTPKTLLCPLTFEGVGYGRAEFLEQVPGALNGFPLVVKEGCGSFGRQVYLIHDMESLRALVTRLGARPILFQEFIAESAGRDLRVYVVNREPVAAIARQNLSGDFRANLAQGSQARAHSLSPEEAQLAIDACAAVGASFGGVDLLLSKEGPLLCEINSNAHFEGLRLATGIDPARAILRMIREKTL